MKSHSELDSGFSLQCHAQLFNINTLKSLFLLYFVYFFFSKLIEGNKVLLCGTVSYLWRSAHSEIAGKTHWFQCRAAVEVHQGMFWLEERSGGNQQVGDYTSGSGGRQRWEIWQKLDLSCPVSCNLSLCHMHPHWAMFILSNLSHRQWTTPVTLTPILILLSALDNPNFFSAILFMFHPLFPAHPISYKF